MQLQIIFDRGRYFSNVGLIYFMSLTDINVTQWRDVCCGKLVI